MSKQIEASLQSAIKNMGVEIVFATCKDCGTRFITYPGGEGTDTCCGEKEDGV